MSDDEQGQDENRLGAGDHSPDNETWDGGTRDSSSPSAILRIMELHSDDNGEAASNDVQQHIFDSSLPLAHGYLGGLTELSGRTLMEEDRIEDLAVLPHGHMVLVPGQTLPVTIVDPMLVTMLRNSVGGGRTFGSVCMTQADYRQPYVADIGTSAEIYAFEEMGSGEVRLKAIGRQRFQIVDWGPARHLAGYYQAKVQVLRERVLPDFRSLASPASWRRRRQRTARHVSTLTPWPAWLYDLYDERKLVERITKFYDSPDVELPKNARPTVHIPTDPTELSFWAAQSLSLSDHMLLQLLRIDSPIQRLRWEISVLAHCRVLCCEQCSREVGKWRDVFSMSAGGPQGLYVNPGGFLHETITLSRAEGLVPQRVQPSAEFSWFPGYGWTIVSCADCDQHMGWLFTALERGLIPERFFGLCRRSITTQVSSANSRTEFRPVQ